MNEGLTFKYSAIDPYAPSTSAIATLGVNSTAPDLNLSLSQGSVSVTIGGASTPGTLKATLLAGREGAINFTCSGLPSDTTCGFTPKQASITAGGSIATSLTVTATATSLSTMTAGISSARGLKVLLLMPALLWMAWRVRNGARKLAGAGGEPAGIFSSGVRRAPRYEMAKYDRS